MNRKPSEILNKVNNYKLVRLAVDRGFLVEVNRDHLYGVEDGDAAFVGVYIRRDRGEDPRNSHREYWLLVAVKPTGTVSFCKGTRSELLSHDEYDAPKGFETALCNDSFLNSSDYGGNRSPGEIPTW